MRIVREAIRANHGGRVLGHPLHVVLAHLEVARASRLQPLAPLLLRATAFGRDGAEHPPRHLRVRHRLRGHDVDDAVDHLLSASAARHLARLARPCDGRNAPIRC